MISKYAPKKTRKCIICQKEFQPTNGRNLTCGKDCHKERKKRYNKKYGKKHPDYMARKSRESIKRNKDKVNERARKRYQRDKNIIKVRNDTNQLLIKLGIKKRGKCMDCGEIKKLQIHHITYTKDDFILICEECHLKRHHKIKRKKI